MGGVIIDIAPDKAKQAFKQLLKDKYSDLEKHIDQTNFLEAYEIGTISSNEFIKQIQQFNPSITDSEITNAWNSMLLYIDPQKIEIINQLRNQYKVYLLSNTNDIHMQWIHQYAVDHLNIENMSSPFDRAFYSYELGLRKPDPAIFRYVIDQQNINPKETLFIDDSEEHIHSAQRLNIKTHHLNLNNNANIISLFHEN